MKVKVVTRYRDLKLGKILEKDTVITTNKERGEYLISRGVVEEYIPEDEEPKDDMAVNCAPEETPETTEEQRDTLTTDESETH